MNWDDIHLFMSISSFYLDYVQNEITLLFFINIKLWLYCIYIVTDQK